MNFIKYLTYNQKDVAIGLYILNAGYNLIRPNEPYPVAAHPNAYKFHWSAGRKLQEFQLNYIVDGEGYFESESTKMQLVKAGSLMILFPNEWHRYKPIKKVGWNEYWIGFNGALAHTLVRQNILNPKNPVLHPGFNEQMLRLFREITDAVKSERFNFQVTAAGILLQIIGSFTELINEKYYAKNEKELLIRQAKRMLVENMQEQSSPAEIARKLNIGYSSLRKLFKGYLGISPSQYQMQHRIIKAKELLTNQNIEIKQIAYSLGFDSASHFNKTFKNKTGITPGRFRKNSTGKIAPN